MQTKQTFRHTHNWRKPVVVEQDHVNSLVVSCICKYLIMDKVAQAEEDCLCVCRTIFLVLLFSQYARNVHFPLPVYKAKKGWTFYRLQVFKMFPVSIRHVL